ncbi:hypothetical protein ACIPSE_39175 [Streptomyces sp. NPDC090106]|uniref:hypothetical protein n=1 Tax=Streptomyces sp. NPDC090106 TaxID=3365946 RepID=UPI0037FC05D8
MYVLVPDDPVFFAQFQSLEEPLLRHLYRLHCAGADSDDERVISDAYDSWVQVLLKLPLWSRWNTGDNATDPVPPDRAQYALYSARGRQLTSLYPLELTAADLGHLTACLDLFSGTDRDRGAVVGRTYLAPQDREEGLAEVLRRVMEVLLLPPPQSLLGVLRDIVPHRSGVLRDVVPHRSVGSVTLPEQQEAEYRRFCEEIVTILSSGDTFAYRSHRAMYL